MNSVEHYKALLATIKISSRVGLFENQLKFEEINEFFYNEVYLKKRRPPGTNTEAESVLSLQKNFSHIKDTCSKCVQFWYRGKQTRTYDKQNDIQSANFYENALMSYLRNIGFNIIRGDDEKIGNDKGFPDLLVLDKDGKQICYVEVKWNASPFIVVRSRLPRRECYEGSLTLNPEKLERQYNLIKKEITIPVFYAYWADFPCIKGIYFTDIENIWDYYQGVGLEELHDRRTGSGDFKNGKKIGQTKIIHPPILEMGNFEEFIQKLKDKVERLEKD